MRDFEEWCPSCREFFNFTQEEVEANPKCPGCGIDLYASVLSSEDFTMRKFRDEREI